MKVCNSFTIDFATGDVLEKDVREYAGPIAECKGGGSSGGTTIQKSEPWEGQKPYMQDVYARADAAYKAGQLAPYMPGFSTIAPNNATSQQAMNQTRARALAGSPLVRGAQGMAQQTLGGSYLSTGNPFLSGALRAAAQPTIENYQQAVMPGIEARMAQSGRYGSGAMQNQTQQAQNALARALAEQSTQAYAQNYNNERGRQMQALQLAPGLAAQDYNDLQQLARVGQYERDLSQEQIDDRLFREELAANAPYTALQRYNDLVMGSSGGGTTTQSRAGAKQNPLLGALGGASTAAGLGTALSLSNPATAGLAIAGGLFGML